MSIAFNPKINRKYLTNFRKTIDLTPAAMNELFWTTALNSAKEYVLLENNCHDFTKVILTTLNLGGVQVTHKKDLVLPVLVVGGMLIAAMCVYKCSKQIHC